MGQGRDRGLSGGGVGLEAEEAEWAAVVGAGPAWKGMGERNCGGFWPKRGRKGFPNLLSISGIKSRREFRRDSKED